MFKIYSQNIQSPVNLLDYEQKNDFILNIKTQYNILYIGMLQYLQSYFANLDSHACSMNITYNYVNFL